ncbi:universal stress protein [Streptomyces sp. NPDC004111]|uniref:universal stress protein n=1 Tax=Streptomyces sp. NPDC004111 TaxID=3364690 RepID=UPI0036B8B277
MRAVVLPLVVGIDGSAESLGAVDWAVDEALLRGLPLRLVHASLWDRYEGGFPRGESAVNGSAGTFDRLVEGAAQRAHRRSGGAVGVSAVTVTEEPVSVLLDEGRNASALVLGSHGRSGVADLLLGSVGLAVASRADCPVVVLRGGRPAGTKPRPGPRIVLGIGRPEPPGAGEEPEHRQPAAAVRFAVEEARARRVPLLAMRAWRCPAHEEAEHPLLAGEPARHHARRAAEALEAALRDVAPDVELERRTVEGPARKVLLDASHGAGLLVIGARRRDGRFGLQIGRVAHTLLHHCACPVAVVPERW